jgi:hypothetical protein
VLAKIARRRDRGMTCVQELPFLRLESAVTDDRGRRARIARVALSIEKDVPKLVIELAYDDDDDFPSGPPAVPYGAIIAPPGPSGEESSAVERVDSTFTLVFRADPIDSLREPPVSLSELALSWWSGVRAAALAIERSLQRAFATTHRWA